MLRSLFTFALLAASVSAPLTAQVTLSPLFTDHAVLQRNKPIPIWGTAAPHEAIDITLATVHVKTTADATGAWSATLPRLAAGGPYTLKANDASATDILIGEVWLASGQSNMEFTLKQVDDPKAAIAASDHPLLHMFTVPHRGLGEPATTLAGSWRVSNPANSGDFSAVGYYFAVSLLEHLKVPIGIIHSSVGGTPAESWTPLTELINDPLYAANARTQSQALAAMPAGLIAYKQQLPAWESQYATEPAIEDPASIASPDSEWKPVTLPTNSLPFRGAAVVWLRRTFTLPPDFKSTRIRVDFGQLLERDTAWVNGQQVGRSGYGDPEQGTPARSYDIPAGVLHPGDNSILIRAFAHTPGRLSLGAANLALILPTAQPGVNTRLPLTGDWQYRLTFDKPLSAEAIAAYPHSPVVSETQSNTGLYNGMIAPLRNYSIAGALWYQGEANAGRAARYPALMAEMIAGWRKQWGYNFPFYIVQLPLYNDNNFPAMRAAEEKISHDVPNTAIAVTIDTGDVTNIHPKNKQPVGDRLALIALHRVYGEKIEDSGPFFASAKPDGGKLRVTFTHAEGLHATGATIPNFEIAGADGKFVPADAVIEKGSIVLSSPQVSSPTSARYAWSPTPMGADVYNSANLPLAPFQTP